MILLEMQIIEGLGLEETLKVIQFQLPALGRAAPLLMGITWAGQRKADFENTCKNFNQHWRLSGDFHWHNTDLQPSDSQANQLT